MSVSPFWNGVPFVSSLAPSIKTGASQATPSAGWATAISTGPTNESGQTVTFEVTNSGFDRPQGAAVVKKLGVTFADDLEGVLGHDRVD